MEFNFYDQYKSYSNIELLKILEQSEHYQRAAVEAAVLVLQEREVSEHERVEVNSQMEVIQQKEQVKQERINSIRAAVTGFFEPMVKSPDEVHPVKWLNILLVITAVQYLWGLLERLTSRSFFILAWYTHGGVAFYFSILLELIYLVYVPLALYLLFKRKRWGWILLFADTMFAAITLIAELYPLFVYLKVNNANVPVHLLSLAFKCVLLYFLWRKQITEYFGVSEKTKRDTALMALIGSPVLLVFLYMLFT